MERFWEIKSGEKKRIASSERRVRNVWCEKLRCDATADTNEVKDGVQQSQVCGWAERTRGGAGG